MRASWALFLRVDPISGQDAAAKRRHPLAQGVSPGKCAILMRVPEGRHPAPPLQIQARAFYS